MTNGEKAREIIGCEQKDCCNCDYNNQSCFDYKHVIKMAQWKDEQHKQDRRIIRNHWQEWAIEQITAFAVHLNKRGAFRDDLCMDFEHEAQSFIGMQSHKKL